MQLDRKKFLIRLISVCLLFLSLLYLGKGFSILIFGDTNRTAQDLFLRWQEQQYIYQGRYPYDVVGGSPYVDPKIGPVTSGGYFPWSFFAQFLFVPPLPWPIFRLYFALLNVASFVILVRYAYCVGKPFGRTAALFSVSACLAMGSYSTTLRLGQYGILINALLIGMLWCLEKRKQNWAGLLLGLAMTKLNIALFYVFVPVILVRINALRTLLIYLVVSSTSIWAVTKVNPVSMVFRIVDQSQGFASKGNSVMSWLARAGINPQVVTVFSALVGLVVVLGIFYFCRQCSLLALFATASVMGRVFLYHRHYDNLMLLFLLLLLIQLTLANSSKLNIVFLSLAIVSLCLPANILDLPYIEKLQILIWIVALGYALIQEKYGPNSRLNMAPINN